MPRFYFEKLVRDKVLDRCLSDAKVLHTEYRSVEGVELKRELVKKITEEGAEVPVIAELNDEVVEEIADIQAVIDALCKAYGISKEQIEKEVQRKSAKNGIFNNGSYIEYVDLADDSEWVGKLREQPDKYREE